LGSPDLSFASESVITDQTEIVDKLLLLEGSSRVLGDLGIYILNAQLESCRFVQEQTAVPKA
jgi:hypothetical protein